ncbi:MAG: DUF4293 domain-containing protein [Muribaculaceae bacterium]|nr:DUF4293 domain-containing protein [Muribaculaceae bacterium]
MMIQRIQSIYLLVATVLAGFFCMSSYNAVKIEEEILNIYPKDNPVILIVSILVALLLFISIFLFKDLKRQKTVILISMFLIVALGVSIFILMMTNSAGLVSWSYGALLLVGALIFALLAYRAISSDQKILRDSDRIR